MLKGSSAYKLTSYLSQPSSFIQIIGKLSVAGPFNTTEDYILF